MLRPHAGEEPDHVLVLGTLGAPQRRMIGAKRPRKVDPEPPPEPVRTTRVTLIDAKALADEAAAKSWLAKADGELRVADAIPVLNRVLHLHRIASADPGPRDVTRELAIVARIGYGVGEQVSTGRSTAALELTGNLSLSAIVSSVRTIATDLLRVLGEEEGDATRAVRRAAAG